MVPDTKPAPKKSTGFLGKIRKNREGSTNKKGRSDETKPRSYETEYHPTENGRMSRSGSKDLLADMPTSGPGRQGTIRKNSLKKKKRKDTNPNVVIPPGLTSAALGGDRRTSMIPGDVLADGTQIADDTYGMIAFADKIDEYYYGVRIFPGQDPANVWVGWVTPQYHSYSTTFNATEAVRKCRFSDLDQHGVTAETTEYRNCFMLNAMELLNAVPDAINTKVSGLLIGCVIDTSIGELSFYAAGQDTNMKFKLEPGAMLYPAVFVTPTSSEIFQFELGRIKPGAMLYPAVFVTPTSSEIFQFELG
uniref:B30.2/SPRY domain-containing protein n=1 Tax=Panagrolaimus sp. PS1159 TaxID=55785 RepID=A0AC35FA94_9BILA